MSVNVRSGWLGFTASLLVASGLAVAAARLLSQDPVIHRAVTASAVAATLVQLAGFGVAKLMMYRKQHLFAAWGGAMAVRFLSLGTYALVVFKAPSLGLVPAPALVTFAALLLATSVAEPIFLNS